MLAEINKQVCAVIVTYNIGRSFVKCFDAIVNQVNEVIIIDNGSNIETITILNKLEKHSKTKIFYNKSNLGIAKALNQGIKYAVSEGYKWILTLDHDSEAFCDMVSTMLKTYYSLDAQFRSKIAIICPRILFKNSKRLEAINSERDYEEVLTCNTSGCLIKAKIFAIVGYLEEKLFIDYVDHEFNLRLHKYGLKIIRINNAILKHSLGNETKYFLMGREFIVYNYSPLRLYYGYRNRIYVWKKYFKFYPKWVLLNIKDSYKKIIMIVFFEKDKLKKLKSISKGIVHGIIGRYNNFS